MDMQNRDVVIKFMQNDVQYQRELASRSQGLDDRFVVGILRTSDDMLGFSTEATDLGYSPRGIVMDAAAKTLSEVLLHDNITKDVASDLGRNLCLCVKHMHDVGMIHGTLSLTLLDSRLSIGHCGAMCQAI